MIGASFSTNLGPVAWAGEIAYRPNQPLQIDSVDLAFAALQPMLPQHTISLAVVDIPGRDVAFPNYVSAYRNETIQPQQIVNGYERFKTIQYDTSFVVVRGKSGNPFGADRLTSILEIGAYQVLNLPSLERLQLDGPGTNYSHTAGIDGTGTPNADQASSKPEDRINPSYQAGGFATRWSYGYRLIAKADYEMLIPGMTVSPQLTFFHDVGGISPLPTGQFVSGRKQISVGLGVNVKQSPVDAGALHLLHRRRRRQPDARPRLHPVEHDLRFLNSPSRQNGRRWLGVNAVTMIQRTNIKQAGANGIGLLAALLVVASATAAVPAEQAAKLGGPQLTPVGAERPGTANGVIPAWTGAEPNLMAKLAPTRNGDFYPDLMAGEKPRFRIDHSNYTKYADQLPAGAIALLARYPDYYLAVYPTHRTAIFPDAIYAATKANATTAKLQGDDTLAGAKLGFPFPIPQTGAEVIWNHKVRYRGDSLTERSNIITVAQNGAFQVSSFEQTAQFFYGNTTGDDDDPNVILKLVRHVLSPPRLAGQFTLVIDKLDGSRDAWLYAEGTNRVLQAPTVAFDTPIASSDGLIANDQADMFNGSMSEYTWKLVGKKLMYIPYNDYALEQPSLKYKQIIRPGHLNPEYLRYELHRVWVVEADLKKGTSNQFSKRVFYVDEDSWTIAAADCYDARGQLWRYEEGFVLPLIREKLVVPAPTVVYSLDSGRYALQNLINEEPYFARFNVSIPRGYFTPQHMKRLSHD